jgi:hypothetical protein
MARVLPQSAAQPAFEESAVDSRRAELQIRLVLATYHTEVGGDSDEVARLRDRAAAILTELEPLVFDDARLSQLLDEARRELRGGLVSPGGRFGQQLVNRAGQFGDRERLG